MRSQKWLLRAIAVAIIPALAFAGLSGCEAKQLYERGAVLVAIEKTLSQPGPVRDDLIERGLFTIPDDTGISGAIKVGEIEKLVEDGVYAIGDEGYLIFGPSYSPPP